MSRAYLRASSEYDANTSIAALTAYPITICGWFNFTDTTSSCAVAGVGDSASNPYIAIEGRSSNQTLRLIARGTAGPERTAATTTTWSTGAWHHALIVASSATRRLVWLDGGGVGVGSTQTITLGANFDTTLIGGADFPAGIGSFMEGSLAEIGMWDSDLSDGDDAGPWPLIAALAAGYSPQLIRPGNLVFYRDLLGDADRPRHDAGIVLTANGTPTTDTHPGGIIYRSRPHIITPPSGGGPSTVSIAGTVTPTGTLTNIPLISQAGTVTPAGTVTNIPKISQAGTVTPSGTVAMVKVAVHAVAGTVTPSGALSLTPVKVLGGTVTPTGAIISVPKIGQAGTVTPTGTITLKPQKNLAGVVTPTGTAAMVKVGVHAVAGTVTPTGALTLAPVKALGGTVTPTGAISLIPKTSMAGTVTPAGTLANVKNPGGGTTEQHSVAGTVTPTGALVLKPIIVPAGTVTPTGAVTLKPVILPAGTVTPTGALALVPKISLAGTVTPTGTVTAELAGTIPLIVTDRSHQTTSVLDVSHQTTTVTDRSRQRYMIRRVL